MRILHPRPFGKLLSLTIADAFNQFEVEGFQRLSWGQPGLFAPSGSASIISLTNLVLQYCPQPLQRRPPLGWCLIVELMKASPGRWKTKCLQQFGNMIGLAIIPLP